MPNPSKPNITSLTPNSGFFGQSIVIAGANFDSSGVVTFNGLAAVTIAWSASSITAVVPVGATSGPVIVTVAAGASNSLAFTVNPSPIATSLTPPQGSPGTTVTITGANFLSGSTTVTFNGVAAIPTSVTNTSITVTVPLTATSGPVVVKTVNGPDAGGLHFQVLSGAINPLPPLWDRLATPICFSCERCHHMTDDRGNDFIHCTVARDGLIVTNIVTRCSNYVPGQVGRLEYP